MNYLILIKHSLPAIAPTVPAKEWMLSRSGQIRCKALAERVASYSPDIVISSVKPKASETAQIMADHLQKPVCMFEGLQEHDRTGVAFLGQQQFEVSLKDFFTRRDELVFGTETAQQAYERFSKALVSVERKYPKKNIAIVSHGTVIALFVERISNLDVFSFWRNLDLPSFVVLSLPQQRLVAIVESVV